MWQLIKSEILYYKWLFIISTLLVIIINFGLTIDERWIQAQNNFPGLRIIWLGVGMVIFFLVILFNRKSGRLRNQILLPLSNFITGISRIIPFLLFWLLLLSILFFFYIVNNDSLPSKNWIFDLISLTGVILFINSIPVLNTDFYSTYFSKGSKIVLGIIWATLWLAYIFINSVFLIRQEFIFPEFFAYGRETLKLLYLSGFTMVLSAIVGLGLFLSSIITFKRRNYFFE